MPVSREDHRGVPLAPAVALGSFHQPLDFGLGQVFAGAQVGVWHALGGDCAIYGGWGDQLEVRLGQRFCPSRADDYPKLASFTDCRAGQGWHEASAAALGALPNNTVGTL